MKLIKILSTKSLYIAIILVLVSPLGYAKERLHLLISGGAGGGWDTTAPSIGAALSRSGLVDAVSFENMSGGGWSYKTIALEIRR